MKFNQNKWIDTQSVRESLSFDIFCRLQQLASMHDLSFHFESPYYFPSPLWFERNQLDHCFGFWTTWKKNPKNKKHKEGRQKNGRAYCESCTVGGNFMDNSLSVHKKDVSKAVLWLLQPPCFYNSCNCSCNLGFLVRWRLEVPSLSSGFNVFSSAGLLFSSSPLHFLSFYLISSS